MVNRSIDNLLYLFKKNLSIVFLFVVAFGLSIFLNQPISILPSLVDWKTIVTLVGLLLTTTGIKESGLFYFLAYRISQQINNQRLLSLFLIFLAAILSMFLTNDIALFIVVPLTLHLQSLSNDDYIKLVVFEAIAVNVGSSLTPIGNPQNIFLWHLWGISFPVFVKEMMPLVLIMALCLLFMALACFPSKTIQVENGQDHKVDKKLFVLSFTLLIFFIISIEMDFGRYFLALIFLLMFFLYKKVVLKADWGLILLFIFLFIDLNLVCSLEITRSVLGMLNLADTKTLFLSGALLPQLISNVPSAIILANHSNNFKLIAYGVNVGGNGLLIASFANLVALRLSKKMCNYFAFHMYSISYFLITLILTYWLLVEGSFRLL